MCRCERASNDRGFPDRRSPPIGHEYLSLIRSQSEDGVRQLQVDWCRMSVAAARSARGLSHALPAQYVSC